MCTLKEIDKGALMHEILSSFSLPSGQTWRDAVDVTRIWNRLRSTETPTASSPRIITDLFFFFRCFLVMLPSRRIRPVQMHRRSAARPRDSATAKDKLPRPRGRLLQPEAVDMCLQITRPEGEIGFVFVVLVN
jgi:hypothetical protein